MTKVGSRPYERIGSLLRNLRVRRGLDQRKLAAEIDIAASYLSRIEAGERRPAPKLLQRFAEVLDHPYEELARAAGLLQPEQTASSQSSDVTSMLQQLINGLQTVTPAAPQRRAISVYDTVPAGLRKDAEVVETHADVAKLVLTEEELGHDPAAFALIVSGDSMVEAGILDGDVVVISPGARAGSGDIAAVRINRSETALKRIYIEDDKVILQSANHLYKPLVLAYPDEVEILGRVILVRRAL